MAPTILERGEVANSWRTQRWDSLRLLTPNWMTRLPGYAYRGADPDGYLGARQVAAMLEDYADVSAAPILTGTNVTSVPAAGGGYLVRADLGTWHAPTVVLACGAATLPAVPAVARGVPAGITAVTPAGYRNPSELPPGGVLVVGASASGVQLADELHRSGRPVTLAVGEHVRMPRTYRGRDILWWLDAAGVLDERYDQVEDLVQARHLPSMQLVGSPGRTVDLNALSSAGVRVVGRPAWRPAPHRPRPPWPRRAARPTLGGTRRLRTRRHPRTRRPTRDRAVGPGPGIVRVGCRSTSSPPGRRSRPARRSPPAATQHARAGPDRQPRPWHPSSDAPSAQAKAEARDKPSDTSSECATRGGTNRDYRMPTRALWSL
jgi:cation diffusion facilitator CzcD-associated flavoprotein CzcO